MSSSDIDYLDDRAEEVVRTTAFSESSLSNDDHGSLSDSEPSETWAQEAAVTDEYVKEQRSRRLPAEETANGNTIPHKKHAHQQQIAEELQASQVANWEDFETERKFLEDDHKSRLVGLLNKLEHGTLEEGDDIDIFSERIVGDTGHLRALRKQGREYDISKYSEDSDESDVDMGNANVDGLRTGFDPMYTVCQEPASLLNLIVSESSGRWIFPK